MKKIILLILIMLISSIVSAEGLLKMRVLNDKIKDKPEDLPRMIATEFISDKVRDANGEVAAMIRIISDVELAGILPGNGAVKDVEVDGSKVIYKVYVQRQERKITITAKGYEPLTVILYDYRIRLEEGKVYQIKITGEKKKELLNVNIITYPEDAEKIIDGESVGNGSTFELAEGEHILRVVKEGKKSFEKRIKVEKSSSLFKDIILQDIEPVGVTINSKPDNANITLDKVDNGKKTNRAMYLFPGKHIIELKKEGYLASKKEVYIEEKDGQEVNFELIKNVALFDIKREPEDIEITINGQIIDSNNLEVVPGEQSVEIKKEGYLPQKDIFYAELGKTYKRSYKLVKNSGILNMLINENNVKISINDKVVDAGKIELVPGIYKVAIEKDKFYKITDIVTVEISKTINKIYELKEITGKLQISVTPVDGYIELIRDGEIIEKWSGTKEIENLRIGVYTLRVQAKDYKTFEQKIEIKENEVEKKDIVLNEFGSIKVVTNAKCKVYIDEKEPFYEVTKNTPVLINEIYTGKHLLKILYPNRYTEEKEVTVKKGEISTANFDYRLPMIEPVLTNPVNNAEDVKIGSVFEWKASCRDVENKFDIIYEVYIDTNRDSLINKEALFNKTTYYTYTKKLEYNTKYYWKVIAKDESGQIKSSDVFSFTTGINPMEVCLPVKFQLYAGLPIIANPLTTTGPSLGLKLSYIGNLFRINMEWDNYHLKNKTVDDQYNRISLGIDVGMITPYVNKYFLDNKGIELRDIYIGGGYVHQLEEIKIEDTNKSLLMSGGFIRGGITISIFRWFYFNYEYSHSFGEVEIGEHKIGVGMDIVDVLINGKEKDVEVEQKEEEVKIKSGTMVYVEKGSNEAGTIDKNFYIGKYEVTQYEFESVMGFNPSYFIGSNMGNNPVEQITWYDAVAYCNAKSKAEGLGVYYNISGIIKKENNIISATVTENKVAKGYRLPSTTEWEYVAIGGKNGVRYTYSGSNTIEDVAWYSSNSRRTTHPVGGKVSNELGIYDLSGNIWEWTNTIYSESSRFICGGGWGSNEVVCTVSSRDSGTPGGRSDDLGFRLVRTK